MIDRCRYWAPDYDPKHPFWYSYDGSCDNCIRDKDKICPQCKQVEYEKAKKTQEIV